ncbi:MAG: hypothetical protein II207_03860 [Clostridia bacterium]|nr:hypothetical protein [Clostridia bacterium]
MDITVEKSVRTGDRDWETVSLSIENVKHEDAGQAAAIIQRFIESGEGDGYKAPDAAPGG